jgi:hypothetical protein
MDVNYATDQSDSLTYWAKTKRKKQITEYALITEG